MPSVVLKHIHHISVAKDGEELKLKRCLLIFVASVRAFHHQFLESTHGSPSVDISLDLAKRTMRTAKGYHIVITNRSRDAISGPVESPHCDARSTQTAFVHISCNLTPKAWETKCATETDSAVAEAVTHACLPVGVLGCQTDSRLGHNDHRRLRLHFQCWVLKAVDPFTIISLALGKVSPKSPTLRGKLHKGREFCGSSSPRFLKTLARNLVHRRSSLATPSPRSLLPGWLRPCVMQAPDGAQQTRARAQP